MKKIKRYAHIFLPMAFLFPGTVHAGPKIYFPGFYVGQAPVQNALEELKSTIASSEEGGRWRRFQRKDPTVSEKDIRSWQRVGLTSSGMKLVDEVIKLATSAETSQEQRAATISQMLQEYSEISNALHEEEQAYLFKVISEKYARELEHLNTAYSFGLVGMMFNMRLQMRLNRERQNQINELRGTLEKVESCTDLLTGNR